MTLLNFPKRSSAEDDALDQALNAWAMDEYSNRHSDPLLRSGEDSSREAHSNASHLAAHAIDFHRWADNTHRSDPAATGPAAGTWNRVLRSTVQTTSRGKDMSSTAFSTEPQSAIVYDPRPYNRRELGRYLNLAATLAIVFAVTVGGWFAMSQLPPGGGDGRFAALQGTPEVAQSQTCDVEPLSVDEALAIVENPYSVVDPARWGTPVPGQQADEANQIQNQPLVEMPYDSFPDPRTGLGFTVPEHQDFEEASSFMRIVLGCMQSGTIGQMWALQSPDTIQQQVLSGFPVYRNQSEIRSSIESKIDQPYPYPYVEVYGDLQMSPNPRLGDARIWVSESSFGLDYSKVLYIGVQAADSNGNTIVTENFEGIAVDGDLDRGNGVAYILVFSKSTNQWVYYGVYAPRG